jgi:hypothetical protein
LEENLRVLRDQYGCDLEDISDAHSLLTSTERNMQRKCTEFVVDRERQAVLDSLSSPAEANMFVRAAHPAASAWLKVMYTHSDLTDVEFRRVMQLRLGARLCNVDNCPRCGEDMGPGDLHALTCKMGRGAINVRHTGVKETLNRVLRKVPGLSIQNEPLVTAFFDPVAHPKQDTSRMRADLAVRDHHGADKKTVLVDVVINHVGNDDCKRWAQKPAAAKGEKTKFTHYKSFFRMATSDILPFAFESSGALGEVGMGFLQRMAGLATKRKRNGAVSRGWMLGEISLALQRDTAIAIGCCVLA